MDDQNLFYIVPDVKLIPQDKNNSCWYASAKMLVQWKRNKTQSTIGRDPSELQSTSDLYRKDEGITDQRIAQLAQELGLRVVPPMTPTPKAIFQWLGRYGPLWVNGISHITVIAGINLSPAEFCLLVYDPLPENKGSIEWRDAKKWYAGTIWPVPGGRFEASGRDTSTNTGIFLYMPD
jgi:hypothetical protein